MNTREYLESFRPTREEVDRFLIRTGADGVQPNHGRTYDAELGWVHADTVIYGVGGYSLYQAYRQMLKIERESPHRVQYLILPIYDDDYDRNLDPWRGMRT